MFWISLVIVNIFLKLDCRDNPLIFVDLLALAQSTPHHMVTYQIVKDNGGRILREQSLVDALGGGGRVDLIDPTAGYMWEVKPITANWDTAISQLNRYTTAISFTNSAISADSTSFSRYNGNPIIDGYTLNGRVTEIQNGAHYDIKYFFVRDGIILYTFTRDGGQTEAHRVASANWGAAALAAASAAAALQAGKTAATGAAGVFTSIIPKEIWEWFDSRANPSSTPLTGSGSCSDNLA